MHLRVNLCPQSKPAEHMRQCTAVASMPITQHYQKRAVLLTYSFS